MAGWVNKQSMSMVSSLTSTVSTTDLLLVDNLGALDGLFPGKKEAKLILLEVKFSLIS